MRGQAPCGGFTNTVLALFDPDSEDKVFLTWRFERITAISCYKVFQVNDNETGFFKMDFKMLTLSFIWRQDRTIGSGEFVMETLGSKHCWKGMSNSYEWGRARIVVLPKRRELSWKKQDPPYRLMDVIASALSDQLSCWLHQRVKREWQINYRNEANLLFLS